MPTARRAAVLLVKSACSLKIRVRLGPMSLYVALRWRTRRVGVLVATSVRDSTLARSSSRDGSCNYLPGAVTTPQESKLRDY